MSQDHGIPNNGWNRYDQNTYPTQDSSSQYGHNFTMQNGTGGQQYQMRGNMHQDQAGYWDPNAQIQYETSPSNYAPNNFYTPPPPPQIQPQYYQPQNPQPIHLQNHYSVDPRVFTQQRMHPTSNIATNQAYPQMAHPKPAIPPVDYPMLVISLAEEYIGAAHELAPAVAKSMTTENIDQYYKLITMGLECLSIALKNLKLQPRLEAKVRLRFASLIYEETNNYNEAETLLSQGIILCESNHYYDLKYAMQFLLARLMYQKAPRASMNLLDGHISDAQHSQHFPWVYVFRFLRASHALELGTPTDSNAAIQNIRSISTLANQQGDRSIFIVASLMEAVMYLKCGGIEAIEHVQRAIAAARTYQLDDNSSMPQLVGLTHILDVICSILRGDHAQMMNTCRAMQVVMDDLLNKSDWPMDVDTLTIPIDSLSKFKNLISQDTRMILGVREDGRGELTMSFLNKKDAYFLTYFLSGVILLNKNSGDGGKALRFLDQGIKGINGNTRISEQPPANLTDLVAKQQWRGQILCYLHLYVAFSAAIVTDWPRVRESMGQMTAAAEKFEVPLSGCLGNLALYLDGVYHQGTGDLEMALEIFSSEEFELSGGAHSSAEDQVKRDISLLAALNRILIQQEPRWQDPVRNLTLISDLVPYCIDHPNKDIQTAFALIRATTKTSAPAMIHETKNHLAAALNRAKSTANTQFLCLVLNIMCSKFFNNCVGDQAEKSALAAKTQAKHSKNKLWISVAGGLLSQFYDISEKRSEAQSALKEARILAHEALPGL